MSHWEFLQKYWTKITGTITASSNNVDSSIHYYKKHKTEMSEFVTANRGQRSWLYSSKVLWAAKTMSDCVSAKGWAMAEAPVSRWENNISGTWSWTLKDTNQRQRRIKVNLITRLATYEWSDNFKEGKMIVSNKEIQSICNIFAQCQTHLFKLNQFPNLFHCLQKCKKCCKKCHISLMT